MTPHEDWPWESSGRPLFITFFVALKYQCPIPHGGHISRTYLEDLHGFNGEMRATVESPVIQAGGNQKLFASLKFWQVSEVVAQEDMHLGPLSQVISEVIGKPIPDGYNVEPESVDSYRTIVEMVTVQNADAVDSLGFGCVTEAFDRCFDLLIDVSMMSRLVERHRRPIVARESVNISVWFGRWSDDVKYGGEVGGVMLVAPPASVVTRTLDEGELERLAAHLQRMWQGSPLELAMDRALQANTYLYGDGDYANAVIHAAMSAEVLLDSTLGLMLWEEQLGVPDIERAGEILDDSRGGLAARVKREYGPRLGGSWDPKSPGPIKQWSVELARLRGRIIHRGYRPSQREAERALEASDSLLNFVKSRLAVNAKKYPRTALLTLGEPGLRRLGGWKSAQAYMASNTQNPPDAWFREYSEWRARVDVAAI
ncbi:hypothetical protein [Streptomyces sp. NPDC003952]